ncbi:mucin-22-like isoform X2 [Odontomachus brunneus]|uniref:mucin-22-like isoform X2 n=1 Tax=Odontomachus brunneus TaxID=486640 RepID=UPI0013F25ECD|nr:mucin-22-like isoform X2 [Odontomachus brunneus]
MWRILYEVFRSIEKLNMKRTTMVFLIFVVLLIGEVKKTMEKMSRSNATTSFTTRLTTHESTTVATRTTTTNTPSTASTTNVVIASTASTTNASTSATSASLSSSTISSSSVTAVKSQTTESTLETNATTNSYMTTTMTTVKESKSETMPIDTTITKNTAISTRDSSWMKESTIETPTSISKVPKTTSEQIITEAETTEVITTEVTTNTDTTPHATVIPCKEFNYVARDANTGVACVQANMTIQINLQYMTNYYRTNEAALTVPRKAKTSGICGEKTAEITLSWKDAVENQADVKENKITFRYSHDDSTYFLDSTSVDVHLDNNNFPNAQHKRIREDTMGRHLRLFSTSMKHRVYIRRLGAEINVGDWVNVLISNISLIAFASCSEANSSRAGGDIGENVNNDVIAGVIIGTIILILIIFFLIWCKKKKNAAIKNFNIKLFIGSSFYLS